MGDWASRQQRVCPRAVPPSPPAIHLPLPSQIQEPSRDPASTAFVGGVAAPGGRSGGLATYERVERGCVNGHERRSSSLIFFWHCICGCSVCGKAAAAPSDKPCFAPFPLPVFPLTFGPHGTPRFLSTLDPRRNKRVLVHRTVAPAAPRATSHPLAMPRREIGRYNKAGANKRRGQASWLERKSQHVWGNRAACRHGAAGRCGATPAAARAPLAGTI